jgi:hypothetical protein
MSIHNKSWRFSALCWAVFALWFSSVPLPAEHGRNFAGEFQIRNVADRGLAVEFELRVKVFNYSGADVKDATLSLASSRPGPDRDAIDFRGSFTGISIPYRNFVELDSVFTVPQAEYQRWQRGSLPNLVVTYRDKSGREVQGRVELRIGISGGLPSGESR